MTLTVVCKTDKAVLLANKKLGKNKKTMIIIASIVLVIIVGVLGEFLSSDIVKKEKAPIVETTAPKVIPVVEKKFVPSLIGNTQAIAEQTIVNNGYLLWNITNNYSDSIEKGLVISQTPVVNTSYEKDGSETNNLWLVKIGTANVIIAHWVLFIS